MLFTEPLFLFLFLPLVLGFYFCSPQWMRNFVLLGASFLFYAWSEKIYVALLLCSCLLSYVGALAIDSSTNQNRRRLLAMLSVASNLLLLCFFKYTRFLVTNLNYLLAEAGLQIFPIPAIHLPIGVSFFTFMGISYVIDVYRRQIRAERSLNIFALYIVLFPHLLAGPIVRYSEIARELAARLIDRAEFAEGIRRFIFGLGKKMLIANTLAYPADSIFNIPAEQLTTGLAWLGVACYTLQIYFDFSGYSDMAIGLARMFGFHFPENFNYPYIADSMTNFWRRWHITLSTWFRDYLFFPLGVRGPRWHIYRNLMVVFLLCGLWHGAGWNFVVWGLFHGMFLVFEQLGLATWLQKLPRVLRHVYSLLVIMVAWVFFRSESLSHALLFLQAMIAGGHGAGLAYSPAIYLNAELFLTLLVGVLGSVPLIPFLRGWQERLISNLQGARAILLDTSISLLDSVILALIFMTSVSLSAAGTYHPFIYFRF